MKFITYSLLDSCESAQTQSIPCKGLEDDYSNIKAKWKKFTILPTDEYQILKNLH